MRIIVSRDDVEAARSTLRDLVPIVVDQAREQRSGRSVADPLTVVVDGAVDVIRDIGCREALERIVRGATVASARVVLRDAFTRPSSGSVPYLSPALTVAAEDGVVSLWELPMGGFYPLGDDVVLIIPEDVASLRK